MENGKFNTKLATGRMSSRDYMINQAVLMSEIADYNRKSLKMIAPDYSKQEVRLALPPRGNLLYRIQNWFCKLIFKEDLFFHRLRTGEIRIDVYSDTAEKVFKRIGDVKDE